MSRKHLTLGIGAGAVLLVLAGLLYALFNIRGGYHEAKEGLAAVQNRLDRLSRRAVFPSPANVGVLRKQLALYQEYLDELFAVMREGQLPAEPVDRDRFRHFLEESLRRLVNEARAKNVTLPADFAFGFQRYAAGILPVEEELPRLMDQLRSVVWLCGTLYEAGIGELVSVERTVFEKEAQVAPAEEEYGRRGLRGQPEEAQAAPSVELVRDPDGLFTRERYLLVFRATDAAVWKILDRLAKGAPFTVVSRLEVTNPARPVVVPPKTEESAAPPRPTSLAGWQTAAPRAPAAEKKEPEVLPRELRVVAGRELTTIRMEVDIYRFAETAAKGTQP